MLVVYLVAIVTALVLRLIYIKVNTPTEKEKKDILKKVIRYYKFIESDFEFERFKKYLTQHMHHRYVGDFIQWGLLNDEIAFVREYFYKGDLILKERLPLVVEKKQVQVKTSNHTLKVALQMVHALESQEDAKQRIRDLLYGNEDNLIPMMKNVSQTDKIVVGEDVTRWDKPEFTQFEIKPKEEENAQ